MAPLPTTVVVIPAPQEVQSLPDIGQTSLISAPPAEKSGPELSMIISFLINQRVLSYHLNGLSEHFSVQSTETAPYSTDNMLT